MYETANFSNRSGALDFLDFHVLDRIDALLYDPSIQHELNELKQAATTVKERLEKIDNDLFYQIREEIKAGQLRNASFPELVRKYCNDDFSTKEPGYDQLDAFVNGILLKHPLPEATKERKPEMVFYQQTPARIILALIENAGLKEDDVFFDLGSGLGHVTILVNLITGIKAIGIEYEPAYCNYANACVLALNLNDIKFIHADARNANYDEGTVFFMYTPFTGGILQDVLNKLSEQSQKRLIRIFTYGPCSAVVAMQNWLEPLNGTGEDHYSLYEFNSKCYFTTCET